MAVITLRSIKGAPLTNTEVDANFSNINTELGTKLTATDYTAADVLTKLKTVDGSGSGLDADLLDGMTSSTANTASTIVARDASGNFSAGTVTVTSLVTDSITSTSGTIQLTDTNLTLTDNGDVTKKAQFELSGITTGTTRTYTLPNVSAALATLGNLTQNFQGQITFANPIVTLGTSVDSSTYGIGTGATGSGNTKTVNIGTAGLSGSTTTINIGSSVSGSTVNVTLNGNLILQNALPIAQGGTGGTTVLEAQTNLQVDPAGTGIAMAIALG